MNETKADLNIQGVAKTGGGTYDKVHIQGVGEVDGDLVCRQFICNGRGKIQGDVITELADVQGATTISGKLKSEQIRIGGSTKIGGSLISEQVEISGAATVKGDCEAESLTVRGSLRIEGYLNAGDIQVKLLGKCTAKEIGGEQIVVMRGKPQSPINKLLKPIFPLQFRTNLIEGDRIHLEDTVAEVVRGNHIVIGQGCEIGLVEYKVSYQADEDAKVGSHRQV